MPMRGRAPRRSETAYCEGKALLDLGSLARPGPSYAPVPHTKDPMQCLHDTALLADMLRPLPDLKSPSQCSQAAA